MAAATGSAVFKVDYHLSLNLDTSMKRRSFPIAALEQYLSTSLVQRVWAYSARFIGGQSFFPVSWLSVTEFYRA